MLILDIPKRLVQSLIVVYQYTLSFDHSPVLSRLTRYQVCRYHPTCSEYGYQAFGKYGAFKGFGLTIKRIFRCNPWNPGGHDPVP
jgi:putative membrane protein insertion efficiency factor